MSYSQVRGLVQFSKGYQSSWEKMTDVLPTRVITYAIDSMNFKIGDGVLTYINLPVLFNMGEMIRIGNISTNVFPEPTIDDEGKIVITEGGKFAFSDYTYDDLNLGKQVLVNQLEDLHTTVNLSGIGSLVDSSINTGTGELVVVNNKKYTKSTTKLTDIKDMVNDSGEYTNLIHIQSVDIYTDEDKLNKLDDREDFYGEDKLYLFVDVVAFHDNDVNMNYSLEVESIDGVTLTEVTEWGDHFFRVKLEDNGSSDDDNKDTLVRIVTKVTDADGKMTRKGILFQWYNDILYTKSRLRIDSQIQWPTLIADDDYIYMAVCDRTNEVVTVCKLRSSDHQLVASNSIDVSIYTLTSTNTHIEMIICSNDLVIVARTYSTNSNGSLMFIMDIDTLSITTTSRIGTFPAYGSVSPSYHAFIVGSKSVINTFDDKYMFISGYHGYASYGASCTLIADNTDRGELLDIKGRIAQYTPDQQKSPTHVTDTWMGADGEYRILMVSGGSTGNTCPISILSMSTDMSSISFLNRYYFATTDKKYFDESCPVYLGLDNGDGTRSVYIQSNNGIAKLTYNDEIAIRLDFLTPSLSDGRSLSYQLHMDDTYLYLVGWKETTYTRSTTQQPQITIIRILRQDDTVVDTTIVESHDIKDISFINDRVHLVSSGKNVSLVTDKVDCDIWSIDLDTFFDEDSYFRDIVKRREYGVVLIESELTTFTDSTYSHNTYVANYDYPAVVYEDNLDTEISVISESYLKEDEDDEIVFNRYNDGSEISLWTKLELTTGHDNGVPVSCICGDYLFLVSSTAVDVDAGKIHLYKFDKKTLEYIDSKLLSVDDFVGVGTNETFINMQITMRSNGEYMVLESTASSASGSNASKTAGNYTSILILNKDDMNITDTIKLSQPLFGEIYNIQSSMSILNEDRYLISRMYYDILSGHTYPRTHSGLASFILSEDGKFDLDTVSSIYTGDEVDDNGNVTGPYDYGISILSSYTEIDGSKSYLVIFYQFTLSSTLLVMNITEDNKITLSDGLSWSPHKYRLAVFNNNTLSTLGMNESYTAIIRGQTISSSFTSSRVSYSKTGVVVHDTISVSLDNVHVNVESFHDEKYTYMIPVTYEGSIVFDTKPTTEDLFFLRVNSDDVTDYCAVKITDGLSIIDIKNEDNMFYLSYTNTDDDTIGVLSISGEVFDHDNDLVNITDRITIDVSEADALSETTLEYYEEFGLDIDRGTGISTSSDILYHPLSITRSNYTTED